METVGKAELATIIETFQHQEDCLSRLSSAMDSVLATCWHPADFPKL
jgi:hypothetical protein